MATTDPRRLNATAQKSVVDYGRQILEYHNRNSEIRNKFEFIDIAYARYKVAESQGLNGEDVLRSELNACGISIDEITIPIVISHIDSYVGYLADVYLSGYPIFPVVSDPDNMEEAEAFQSILDVHALQGRYSRQLGMAFTDASKYNFCAAEVDWAPLSDYELVSALAQVKDNKPQFQPSKSHFNKIKRLDPYNTIIDLSVLPVDVPMHGEFGGYIEMLSHVELRRKLAYYESTTNGYNTSQAQFSSLDTVGTVGSQYYKEKPRISNYITDRQYRNGIVFDWIGYLTGTRHSSGKQFHNCYEHLVLYARIIPSMLGIENVPAKNSPQVWKFCYVNHEKLVYAARMYNTHDSLPIYIGQPYEDGFGFQTPSVAENAIPFQSAASKLFSIRLNAARRAVMDRALYDPQMINASHMNSPVPAAKIPIRDNSRINGKTLEEAYKQIPFDSKGTETVISDMASVISIADRTNGINQPFQGQFQKGNKSRKEWTDTMEGATNRPRLRALSLEYQFILPIKEQIKFNVFQYGVTGNYQSPQTGTSYEITPELMERMKKKISQFKLADGFHPSDKIASVEVLQLGMQTISNSPVIQQQWGPALPRMFAHLMSLGGVTGLEQYLPKQNPQAAPTGPAAPPAPPTLPPSV